MEKIKLKRGYLTENERNFYMVMVSFIQMIEGERNLANKISGPVWEEWAKHDMLTPEMQKDLKLSRTYLKKFQYTLESLLDKPEVEKLHKKTEKFDFRLLDDYTLKKVFRDVKDYEKYITMDRDVFSEILQDVASVKCVGCKEDYKKCPLHKALDDIDTPYVKEQPNCPFACDLGDFSPEEAKRLEEFKVNINKKNKVGVPYD